MTDFDKIEHMIDKIIHKSLKNIYLGKEKAITIKRKGLRKDSTKRQLIEFVLNRLYLENYGKIQQEIINKLLWGDSECLNK